MVPQQPGRQVRTGSRDNPRTAVLWDRVQSLLGSEPARVVDLGGGTGGLAVRVAELGHHVIVVDPSPDALAALQRRAEESGVLDRVLGVQGDATDLLDHVASRSADVVLCHGVLEVVDDPGQALDAAAAALRPGGRLSVVVAGRLAGVLARALAGHFVAARELLEGSATDWRVEERGPRRWARDEIVALLTARGFEVDEVHGLRVFADLVPAAVVDTEPGAPAALVALERAVSEQPELSAVAAQLLVLSHRP